MEKNFMLQGATKLTDSQMKSVKGGIPAEEYCATLKEIVTNNVLTSEACAGAQIGAETAGCSFTLICD